MPSKDSEISASTAFYSLSVVGPSGSLTTALPSSPTGSFSILPASPSFSFKYASFAGGNALDISGGELTGMLTLYKGNSALKLPDGSTFYAAGSKSHFLEHRNNKISGIFDSFVVNEALSVLPLGTKTAAGVDAYGLHVSAAGGLQLFGTHFMLGTVWDGEDSGLMPGLKIVNNNLSMYSDDAASLGFDYANRVTFRTMPNDGYEATYGFEAWEWSDDTHTVKQPTAGVKLLKPSQKSALVPTSVLNMEEGDTRWGTADCFLKTGGSITGNVSFENSYGTVVASLCFDSYGVVFKPDNYLVGFGSLRGFPVIYTGGGVPVRVPDTRDEDWLVLRGELSGYVPRSDYEALLARVEALEAGAPGSGVAPTLSFPVGAADGTKWDSEVASASQNGTTVTLSAFSAAGRSYVVRVYGVDRTTLTASSEVGWLSDFMTNGSVFWDEDLNHGYVAFTVARNSESYDRTATIRLVSSALPGEQYSIVVLQEGAAYGPQ